MFLKQAEQIGGVLVYDNVFARDMDTEAIGSKVFSVLEAYCQDGGIYNHGDPQYTPSPIRYSRASRRSSR
jgi:hypothetical protein